MIPLRRAVQKHTRGTTQIASPSQAIPLIGLQQALSTDAADAGGFYSLSFSSLRLGSDSRTPAPWLAPSAISLGVQLAFDPLRLSLSFNLLESYHSFLKLSTKKCAAQRKMSSPDERPARANTREKSLPPGGRWPRRGRKRNAGGNPKFLTTTQTYSQVGCRTPVEVFRLP